MALIGAPNCARDVSAKRRVGKRAGRLQVANSVVSRVTSNDRSMVMGMELREQHVTTTHPRTATPSDLAADRIGSKRCRLSATVQLRFFLEKDSDAAAKTATSFAPAFTAFSYPCVGMEMAKCHYNDDDDNDITDDDVHHTDDDVHHTDDYDDDDNDG